MIALATEKPKLSHWASKLFDLSRDNFFVLNRIKPKKAKETAAIVVGLSQLANLPPPKASIELCRSGLLEKQPDDLFASVPQSWRKP